MLVLLPRFGNGGASKVACLLANQWAARGWAVTLATLGPDGDAARRFLEAGVTVTPLTARGGTGRGVAAQLLALPALVRLIRAWGPDVLLSAGNHVTVMATLAHALAGRRETGLALKLTNPIARAGRAAWRTALKRQVYGVAMRRAAAVLVLSPEDAAEAVAVEPRAAGKTHVVLNPYLDAAPGPVARLLDADPLLDDGPLILAVGRLTEQKNMALLLDAVARLGARPWRLQVLGAGGELAALEAQAQRLGIGGRVTFAGYVADPAPWYRAARVLAIPSRWEGLPAVAIEAMAAGCPVVTTDCSAALSRVVRRSGAGRVAGPGPDAFAAALAQVLDGPADCPRAEAIADYTAERSAQSHEAALDGLGAGAGGELLRLEPLRGGEALGRQLAG